MSDFWTLFKYEFKLEFPFKHTKGKKDIVGHIFSIIISLLVVVAFIFLISSIVNKYLTVKIDKISAPLERAHELLNVIYLIVVVLMSFLGVEKMRSSLTQRTHKEIFLRLPVKQNTIFLSKLSVLLIWFFVLSIIFVIPINLLFFLALDVSATFWLRTILITLLLPIFPFVISCILIVPYIKIVDFIKTRYVILFVVLSVLLIGAFAVYSEILIFIQELLETGTIKFLFNLEFIHFLQGLLKISYPVNTLASIALNISLTESLFTVLLVALGSCVVVYFVTKALYFVTLYRNESPRKIGSKPRKLRALPSTISLVKKEFITVFREPKHLFSYFTIAAAMPMMVYCCYTMFELLIKNSIGISANFSLSLLIVLIFTVLTNTFCSTNITRDGLTTLKIKTLPVNAKKVVLAKVIFCDIISSLAIILSVILLIAATSLTTLDGLVCIVCGVLFSTTHIYIATRLDLNYAKISVSPKEIEIRSNRVMATAVGVGSVVSIAIGVASLIISIFSKSGSMNLSNYNIHISFAYLVPIFVCLIYFALGFMYYRRNIEESFNKLTM